MSKKLVLVTAAALFDSEGRVLLAQRPEGKSMAGLWEFPGGKIEASETPEIALVRELEEELGIRVNVKALKSLNFVSFDYEQFHDLKNYDAPAADIPLFKFLADGRHLESI